MKLRGAVVGVGYLGNFHAQKMKALQSELDFQMVGVCDALPALAEQRARELNTKAFTNFRELAEVVDLVTVASTTPSHFEIAKYFLEQGKHVNVEKPMSLKASEAQELVKLAKSKNVLLAVGHSERFSPVFVEIRKKIKKPMYMEFHRHAPFKARGSEVSVVMDLMIHDLDLMLSLDPSACRVTSSALGSFQGGGSGADWVQASFAFASGLRAMISVSRVASLMNRLMRVVEKDQVLSGDFQTGVVEVGAMNVATSQMEFQKMELGKSDNLLLENKNFILACLGREALVVSGQDGSRAVQLAEEVVGFSHELR